MNFSILNTHVAKYDISLAIMLGVHAGLGMASILATGDEE